MLRNIKYIHIPQSKYKKRDCRDLISFVRIYRMTQRELKQSTPSHNKITKLILRSFIIPPAIKKKHHSPPFNFILLSNQPRERERERERAAVADNRRQRKKRGLRRERDRISLRRARRDENGRRIKSARTCGAGATKKWGSEEERGISVLN